MADDVYKLVDSSYVDIAWINKNDHISKEIGHMSINANAPKLTTRDYADRVGAIVGTTSGTALASYLFATDSYSNLSINGETFPDGPVIDIAIFLLTIGLCANLGRNGSVGIHDTVNVCIQGTKKLYEKVTNCFNTCIREQQSDIADNTTPGNTEEIEMN